MSNLSIVLKKRLAHLFFFLSFIPALHARDWTVYIYMEASDSYKEADEAVRKMHHALQDQSDRIAVYIDIQAGSFADRISIERGELRREFFKVCHHQDFLKEGIARAFTSVSEGKTLIIISGHGTGILTPTYDEAQQKWLYEPDSGVSLCTRYGASCYEQFCKHIYHVMEGKSLLTADGRGTFLSIDELGELMTYSAKIIGKKLDILGYDACYMAMLEVGYHVKDCVRYLVASQDCEEKEGWDYGMLIDALSHQSASHVARHLVYGYERTQTMRGSDRFSLSALDLSYCEDLADAFDEVLHSIARDDTQLLEIICRTRLGLHHVTGLPFYVDVKEFIESLYMKLFDYQLTPERERLISRLVTAREALSLMVSASVGGPSCTYLKGCSIYFPLAHIDRSYKGRYMKEREWEHFLQGITSGKARVL